MKILALALALSAVMPAAAFAATINEGPAEKCSEHTSATLCQQAYDYYVGVAQHLTNLDDKCLNGMYMANSQIRYAGLSGDLENLNNAKVKLEVLAVKCDSPYDTVAQNYLDEINSILEGR
jgi:hypothetical protein